MKFAKYEGLGNDFVIVDDLASATPSLGVDERRALCDRHRGVGADGVLTLLAPREHGAVARMHITNADGSEPEMCGNGLRCVSMWLKHNRVVAVDQEHVVQTDAGPRKCTVLDEARVKVEMGAVRFDVPEQIPSWNREMLVVEGHTYRASAASMGNPHMVLEAEADVQLAMRIGPLLEVDERFPQRTNVELCKVRDDTGTPTIDVVVWERGVGITEACGTGACAVAAVFARAGRVPYDTDVVVRLPGGPLIVHVPSMPEASLWMTGPARRVFTGEVA